MGTDDLDTRLHRLAQATERSAGALLDVELDPTRELLEKARLDGRTADGWRAVHAALSGAWVAQAALEAVLEQARTLRAARSRLRPEQAVALDELVDGRSVEDGDPARPPSTPAAVLDRVARACQDARDFLAAVSRSWDDLVPRLSRASATLVACAELLEHLGAPPRPELGAARRELARLTDLVARDPLSVPGADVDALEAAVAAVRAGVEALRDFRAQADVRLGRARELLDELRRAADEGRRAHGTALQKIAGVEIPGPLELPGDVEGGLDEVAALARSGAWQDAGAGLDRWSAHAAALLDDARRRTAATRAPLQLRDELRGRLGAYRAKARALRLLEDPAVSERFDRAHDALHSAPTDLRRAARLVRDYQDGLSGRPAAAPSEREALG